MAYVTLHSERLLPTGPPPSSLGPIPELARLTQLDRERRDRLDGAIHEFGLHRALGDEWARSSPPVSSIRAASFLISHIRLTQQDPSVEVSPIHGMLSGVDERATARGQTLAYHRADRVDVTRKRDATLKWAPARRWLAYSGEGT